MEIIIILIFLILAIAFWKIFLSILCFIVLIIGIFYCLGLVGNLFDSFEKILNKISSINYKEIKYKQIANIIKEFIKKFFKIIIVSLIGTLIILLFLFLTHQI